MVRIRRPHERNHARGILHNFYMSESHVFMASTSTRWRHLKFSRFIRAPLRLKFLCCLNFNLLASRENPHCAQLQNEPQRALLFVTNDDCKYTSCFLYYLAAATTGGGLVLAGELTSLSWINIALWPSWTRVVQSNSQIMQLVMFNILCSN